jgi:hypothetical protein
MATLAANMKLLAHHDMDGFGNCGEGMALQRAKSIQINDVYIDEKRIVYAVDRIVGGLYILEMKL